MTRGRRPIPDSVKALKGNPGKRKLSVQRLTGDAEPEAPPVIGAHLRAEAPDYLTHPRERAAFEFVLESLPASIARRSDVHAIARWATWLNHWVTAKLELDRHPDHFYETKSKHGNMLRQHPMWKKLGEAESRLLALEDRLALNVSARHSVLSRLFQMPAAAPINPDAPEAEPDDDVSPLNFLAQSGRPN